MRAQRTPHTRRHTSRKKTPIKRNVPRKTPKRVSSRFVRTRRSRKRGTTCTPLCKRVPDRYTRRARNSFKRGGTPSCRPDFDPTYQWDTLDKHVHMSWSNYYPGGYTIRCSSTNPATIWTKGQIQSFTFKLPDGGDDARSVFVGAMCMSKNDGDGEYDREILGSFTPLWDGRETSQESIAYNKTWWLKSFQKSLENTEIMICSINKKR